MTDEKNKKYQAAIAGVMMYLEEEMKNNSSSSVLPVNLTSSWAQYGRQTIMSNRNMMQFRLKKR